jgi:phosphatidylinositol glycan class M
MDHRHNFSPFFYPIYLQMFSQGAASTGSLQAAMDTVIRHPLASFLPQFSLAMGSGLVLPATTSVTFTWFVQTVAFVTFNKVCTSQVCLVDTARTHADRGRQYFIWYLFFLPIVIPQLEMTRTRAVACLAVWIGSQVCHLSSPREMI